MKIDVFSKRAESPAELRQEFENWLGRHDTPPTFLALHQSVPTLAAGLASEISPATALHGATSCLGVMSEDGPAIDGGAGAFGIWDDEGNYGTSVRDLGDDPRAAARAATEAALEAADRPGEAPDFIWLSSSPGSEELVIAGIEDAVGRNVPVMGGSAADDTVTGEWRVFGSEANLGHGIVVSVLFPSTAVSFAYHNGYAPTDHEGTVTKADGRLLMEIDGRPAADVYRAWTSDAVVPRDVPDRTAILSESTLSPLGRYLESVGGVPYFILAHPAGVLPDGSLELFADVATGEKLTLMTGSPDHLTRRAGKVATLAIDSERIPEGSVAGALMVYCGGCMLAVKDRLCDVTDGIRAALPNTPFMGIFTFGEQGMVMDGRNRHGNLMISAVIFGK